MGVDDRTHRPFPGQ